jgi:imidazolonepropionase-like amidohydrolase
MRRLVFFTVLCLAACSPPPEPPPSSNVTLFEGARLIAGDGSAPIEASAFLVEGGILVAARGEIPVPEGAARVDLTGKTVMPLLVAIHAHLGYDKDARFAAENYTRETITDQLDRLLWSRIRRGERRADADLRGEAAPAPRALRGRQRGRS